MGASGLGVAELGNPRKPKPAVRARGQPAGSLNPRNGGWGWRVGLVVRVSAEA